MNVVGNLATRSFGGISKAGSKRREDAEVEEIGIGVNLSVKICSTLMRLSGRVGLSQETRDRRGTGGEG